MMSRKLLHEGRLVLDRNRRYCIWEEGRPACQAMTLTSGCALEVWLNREWVGGCVEGDGQDYWLFVKTGGKFLLAERMKVRYREPE
jgi:uncharacterized protein YqjF (DUF2071 family)